MQRVAIFLRNSGGVNKFRRAILNTLRTDLIDEALVCSGFFQDDSKYSMRASSFSTRGFQTFMVILVEVMPSFLPMLLSLEVDCTHCVRVAWEKGKRIFRTVGGVNR